MKNLRFFNLKNDYANGKLKLPYPCVSKIDDENLIEIESPNMIKCKYRIDYKDIPYSNKIVLFDRLLRKNAGIMAYSVSGEDWVYWEDVKQEEVNNEVTFSEKHIDGNDYRYLPDEKYAIASGEFDDTVSLTANFDVESTSLMMVAYNNGGVEYVQRLSLANDYEYVFSEILMESSTNTYFLQPSLIELLNGDEYIGRNFKLSFAFVKNNFDDENIVGDDENIIDTTVSFIKILGGLPAIIVDTKDVTKNKSKYVNVKYRLFTAEEDGVNVNEDGNLMFSTISIWNKYLYILDTRKVNYLTEVILIDNSVLLPEEKYLLTLLNNNKINQIYIGKNIVVSTNEYGLYYTSLSIRNCKKIYCDKRNEKIEVKNNCIIEKNDKR